MFKNLPFSFEVKIRVGCKKKGDGDTTKYPKRSGHDYMTSFFYYSCAPQMKPVVEN